MRNIKLRKNIINERWFSPIDRTLRRELKSKFVSGGYWFDTTNYKELVDLRIKYEEGYFKFLTIYLPSFESGCSERLCLINLIKI